jgi:hypothetical protein
MGITSMGKFEPDLHVGYLNLALIILLDLSKTY